MGLTENERAELRNLAANIRDDRLRGLVFKLLDSTEEKSEETTDDRAVPKHSRHR